MHVSKPYKFIEFGAMDVSKPYKFIGFGALDVTKPYKFIGCGRPVPLLACVMLRCWSLPTPGF